MPIVSMTDKGELQLIEVDLDGWKSTFRRLLINGPPLSGKTSSLATFPAPRHIIIAPGELGHSSIRDGDGQRVYYWQFDVEQPIVKYMLMWQHVKRLTQEIITGKHGPCETLAIDGLHKLYYVIMKAYGYTSDTDPRAYTKFHEEFTNYVAPLLASKIPYVVATCYDGNEASEAGSKVTQVFPDLPGKMAKQVMGMFPVVFHSERQGDGTHEKFVWRLRASGKVQGCGVHLPKEVTKIFPAEADQDWAKIESIVERAA